MSEPITILIVDDHEVVRKGVRSYLETLHDFRVVGETGSGEEGIELVSELIPDIVLLDLIMPGMIRSSRTTSGISSETSSTPSSPEAASPTTRKSGKVSR